MKAERIGMFVAVLCGALALPPVASEALADRVQQTTVRTGGNAAHQARPTVQRPTAQRPTTQRPTAQRPTAQRPGNARPVATADARRGNIRQVAASTRQFAGGLSCVPYARMVTGMNVSGNAAMWWHNAAGTYQRGPRPETGAVLVFRATGGMRVGHVAVVERVVSNREILIHHSNWGGPGIRRGTVMRGVSVLDASDNNDWSVVRVQVGHDNANYGRNNPTYGFIHNRPDQGRIMRADAGVTGGFTEMAEAPAARSPHAQAHESASLQGLTASSRR